MIGRLGLSRAPISMSSPQTRTCMESVCRVEYLFQVPFLSKLKLSSTHLELYELLFEISQFGNI